MARNPTIKLTKFRRALDRAAKRASKNVIRAGEGEIESAAAEMRLRANLEMLAREYHAKERDYIKQFRHEIATLKRQGIVSKRYDARGVLPTRHLENVRRQFADVLAGETRARRVKNQGLLDTLRQAGARLVNRRVILPSDQFVRGKSILTKGAGKSGTSIKRIKLKGDWETTLGRMMKNLGPDEYAAFSVAGNPYRILFKGEDTLVRHLTRYLEQKNLPEFIDIFRVPNQTEFFAEMRERDVERAVARIERRRARDRARYHKKHGMKHGQSISTRKR